MTYYRKLQFKRPPTAGPREVGTRVHACVALYYELKSKGIADTDARDAAIELHDQLAAEDLERSGNDSDTFKEIDLTRAITEGYFEWLQDTGADDGLTIVAAEEVVEIERNVPDTGVSVTIGSKLDLRVRDENGSIVFVDHKIVQDFGTPTKTLSIDEQMIMYDWLLQQVHPDMRIDGAIYNMMRKVKRTANAKPPFYSRFRVRHSPQEIETFRLRLIGELQDLIRLRQELDDGADHQMVAYPSPTRNCSWDCDFFAVCGLMNRPQDKPENLIKGLYVVGDPYERYDGGPDQKGVVD
jgi:hypothetical protein